MFGLGNRFWYDLDSRVKSTPNPLEIKSQNNFLNMVRKKNHYSDHIHMWYHVWAFNFKISSFSILSNNGWVTMPNVNKLFMQLTFVILSKYSLHWTFHPITLICVELSIQLYLFFSPFLKCTTSINQTQSLLYDIEVYNRLTFNYKKPKLKKNK